MTLGFEKPLYILPFDPRGSYDSAGCGRGRDRSSLQGRGGHFRKGPYLALNALWDSIRQAVNQTPAIKKHRKD
jgi:hypothetical protein